MKNKQGESARIFSLPKTSNRVKLPYSRQSIGEDDIRAVSKVLRSPFLTQGPEVGKFERTLTRYTGARYCVAFSSGTAALHAAYFAAGIRHGDEVVVPALTFAATANAALYLGARPVFADILSDTGNVDVKDAEQKLTKRIKMGVTRKLTKRKRRA